MTWCAIRASIWTVTSGVLSNPRRWRAFADAVALALGINVWISVVVLPGFFVGIWQSTAMVLAGIIPLLALGAGLWRRSEVILLLIFPSTLLVPVGLVPEMASSQVYGLTRFLIVGVGLVVYLLGVSFFISFHEMPAPTGQRPLASSRVPEPARWQRRFRVYWAFTLLSVVFPLSLLHAANFDDSTRAFLRQMFPGRVAHMTTVLNLLVIGLWVLVYIRYFLGPLQIHRTGDRALVSKLLRIRAEAGHSRPRPVFFVGVACTLVFLLLFFFSRYS